jgi:hypothetical protein
LALLLKYLLLPLKPAGCSALLLKYLLLLRLWRPHL